MEKNQYLYIKISQEIEEKIQKGELKQGECLPKGEQLAKEYGVSAITITHALNRLKEKGYLVRIKGKGSFIHVPDLEARREEEKERKQRTETPGKLCKGKIGVVLEHISSCFGLDLLYMLDQCAEKAGYKVLVRFSYGDRQRETEEIHFLKKENVLGMVIMPCHGTYYNVDLLKLIIDGLPVVLLDKQMEGVPVSSVRTDNYHAMEKLVGYLQEKGKQKIGFICPEENGTSSVIERKKGFFKAVDKCSLQRMEPCYLTSDEKMTEIFSEEINREWIGEIENYLDENRQLDGIVCTEYGIARCLGQLSHKLKERGILAGCIDEDYLSSSGMYFAHVRQNEKEIAKKAMELLLHRIQGEEYRQGNYLVEGIFREACGERE